MAIAVRGMSQQIHLMSYYTDNIAYADVPGYQRKVPVTTSFAEHMGMKAVDTVNDTSVGRIYNTLRPLDLALNTKGYFQKLQADGRIELTRDGRMRLDKTGTLMSTDNLPILSREGKPIRFPVIPDKLENIRINPEGVIEVLNPLAKTTQVVGQIGIASEDGSLTDEVDVRQGHIEASNVFLHEEFVAIVGPKRNFQANRQMFLTHSQVLSRLIQEMGRAQ